MLWDIAGAGFEGGEDGDEHLDTALEEDADSVTWGDAVGLKEAGEFVRLGVEISVADAGAGVEGAECEARMRVYGLDIIIWPVRRERTRMENS